ncbi:MAG: YjjG family noncanonical pyrimidine nucleotidase [Muribaculaceae bacterium]|nr:YjjG family noncanonical pyrimidine nucleotidase [Muribaculaceae bacterium]
MTYDGCDIKWAWVDLDDTLIDFTVNARRALTRLYRTENLDRLFESADEWAECYERHNKSLWSEYNVGKISRDYLRMERFMRPLVEGGLTTDEAEKLSSIFDVTYLDFLAEEKQLVPGALDLLNALRNAGCKIGILSNGFKEVQHRKIASAGLDGLIDVTILSDDINVNKPDIRLYEHAMTTVADTDASHHLMIGDNPTTDIAGAINAGWKAIYFNRFDNEACYPHVNCKNVHNLSDILPMLGPATTLSQLK